MELVAERLVAGGAALAHAEDGRVVFVDGALPGERIEATVTERRRDYLRAAVAGVLEPSPDRVEAPCPALAAGCGGCQWQHVRPEAQAPLKAGIVADALRRIAGMPDAPAISVLPGPAAGYRTTVRAAVDGSGRLGYRRRGSHDVVVPAACLVLHPRLEELLVAARFPGAREVVLRVSEATGERIALVTGRRSGQRVPADVVVATAGDRRMPSVTETVHGVELRVSAPSFFQPGPAAAAALAGAVGSAVGEPGGRVADLYGGVGLFAATAGRGAAEVTIVERSRWAAADARHNVPGARVVEADVAAWRPSGRYDRVIADPARGGLGRRAVERIAASGAGTLVLVSCDPAAMARDARALAGAGFALEAVTVVDTFAHTAHVETVSTYRRLPLSVLE